MSLLLFPHVDASERVGAQARRRTLAGWVIGGGERRAPIAADEDVWGPLVARRLRSRKSGRSLRMTTSSWSPIPKPGCLTADRLPPPSQAPDREVDRGGRAGPWGADDERVHPVVFDVRAVVPEA